jgi:hypothetical protein
MQLLRPPENGDRSPSKKGAVAAILLAGSLSVLCAEVFSGASVLWIINPVSWVFMFPLYLAHLLLFFNLAVIFRKTSLSSLYLWGVIFGMYESWITKVTWAGYMGQQPQWGTVLGFAPAEFLIIIFFWHPVMSFMVPLFLFETLSTSQDRNNPVIAGHAALLLRGKRSTSALVLLTVIGATFLSFNAKFAIGPALITLVGTAAIIAVLWYCTTQWNDNQFSVFSLTLSRRGFAVLLVYLASLYGLMFFLLLPERIALPLTLFLTVLFYAVIILLLRLDAPVEQPAEYLMPDQDIVGTPDLVRYLGLAAVLVVLFCLVSSVGTAAGIILYIACTAGGPVLAVYVVIHVFWKEQTLQQD